MGSLKDSKKVEKKAESIKKPNIVSESKVEPKQSQSAPVSTVKVLPTMPILALPCLQTSSKVEQNKANDADFEALIAPKKVNLKPTKETTDSTKVSGTDKAKNTDDNAQKVLMLDEKITSVKVTSPKAQEMIEDTIEVAAKAVIENSDNVSEKSDKTSAKDMTEEKFELETKEEVNEEAIKDEQEGILPRRRGRSTVASPKVTPLKKKKDKSPEEPSTTKEEVSRKNKKRKEILEPEKSPASRTEIKDETRKLKKIETEEESDPSSVTAKESESNVPKKKRSRPKRAQPDPEPSTSEDSSQEKEKENSSSTVQDSSPSIKEREPE